jgi:hypothetical protein
MGGASPPLVPRASLWLLGFAMVFPVAWGLARLAGWASGVEALTGASVEPGAAWRGAVYAGAWLGLVLIAPSLVLAALIRGVVEVVGRRRAGARRRSAGSPPLG